MFRLALPALIYAALAAAAIAITPAWAQDAAPSPSQSDPSVGIESLLTGDVRPGGLGRFLADGFTNQDRLLQIDDYRRTQPRPAYDNGALFAPDYGGDTHRARAARSGGNILNIFNLGN